MNRLELYTVMTASMIWRGEMVVTDTSVWSAEDMFWRATRLHCGWAIVRADGIVIACSRLTPEQTRALYTAIGRPIAEAA